jgi:outer membrane protein OmpA-like peptidoglycan-associated protein
MQRFHTHLLVLALLLVSASKQAFGQGALLTRGDHYFEDFSFTRAAETYEMAFKKDASSIPHARRLAECYWNLREPKQAEPWYAVVAASSQATAVDLYRYSELLRMSGQFADADMWLKRYAKLKPGDSRVELKDDAVDKLSGLLENPGITYKIVPADFNSDKADIAPFIHKNTIYFASSRALQLTSRRTDSWNDQPFLNLFNGKLAADGTVSEVKPMGDDMNTQYHESNVVISDDGSEMYFTRNNFIAGRSILGENGVNNLQIFVRHLLPQGWSKEVPFTYNSSSYSVGHPALTKDSQRIFFTSDKPGGLGGKDIYVCERDPLGAWGEPKNLGPAINTEGDEMFPYVFGSTLYFASDGHLGLGGLDLFSVTMRGDEFGVVENLNAPINSPFDDFGLCLDERGELGYLTSDRDGHIGTEDIYTFIMNSKPEDNRKWAGRVLDMSDAQPIPYLTIRLLDSERREIAQTTTDLQGTYEFPAPKGNASVIASIEGGSQVELGPGDFAVSPYGDTELPDIYLNSVTDLPVNVVLKDARTERWLEGVSVTVKDARNGNILFIGTTNEDGITKGEVPDRRFGEDQQYDVIFTKSGYFTKTVRVDFRVLAFLEQALTGPEGAEMNAVETGIDIAKAMNLKPIYFDYRESSIRPDAALELDQVVETMTTNPTIKISLRSHTDSRASTEYNDALSERRAQSTKDYLVKHAIDPSRIQAKGYGERDLVNKCADGVGCSEEEHQMNRRTEFIITECNDCGAVGSIK